RHGRKTARSFTGYKLHAAAAVDAPIVTAISVSAGNEHDGQQAAALLDQQTPQRRPARVLGDTAYGNIEVREQLEQRAIGVLAPVHSTSPKQGAIAKEHFQIDLDADTVTCPQGNTTQIYKPSTNRANASGEGVARFARSDCAPTPLR